MGGNMGGNMGSGGEPSSGDNCAPEVTGYDGPSLTLTDAQLLKTLQALFPFQLEMPPMPNRFRTKHGFTSSPINNTLLFGHVETLADAAEVLAIQAHDHLDEMLNCSLSSEGTTCVQGFIDDFGARAFRRPLTTEEHQAFFALYSEMVADGVTPELSTSAVIAAVLQSPQFLYQLDVGSEGNDDRTYKLTSYEIASHLSYLITNGPPDATLQALALEDALQSPATLRAQALRLIETPAGHAAMKRFVGEWFGTADLNVSGRVSAELADAFAQEIDRDLEMWMFDSDVAPISTLLSAETSYLNGALAEHYGLSSPSGPDGWQLTELPEHYRGGLLTKAMVSTAYSNIESPSVILRGVFVIQQLMCRSLGTPPGNAVELNPDLPPGSLPREKVEARGKISPCNSCHSRIDPVGLGMEPLDQLGRFRTEYEGGTVIDPSGSLEGTDFSGATGLAQQLAQSQDFSACAAEQWSHYTFGGDVPVHTCQADTMAEVLDQEDNDFYGLVLGTVNSNAFLYRQRRPL